MTVALFVLAGLLAWTVSTLMIDAWIRYQGRPSLVERLASYMPTVADEAAAWLRDK